MKRREFISAIGLVALTEATRAKAAAVGNRFLSSGAEFPGARSSNAESAPAHGIPPDSSMLTVAISPGNQGVRLRRRCDKANNRQQARVYIDGALVTEHSWYNVDYEKTYRDIRWFNSDFDVPAKDPQGKSKITVRVEFISSKTGRWDEYHYWICSYSAPLLSA